MKNNQSPCNKKCTVRDGTCISCKRTLLEITQWENLGISERMDIINQIVDRPDWLSLKEEKLIRSRMGVKIQPVLN